MFCTACGVRNAESSNFCKQCGHKIDRASISRISEEAYDRALPMEEQIDALLERAYRLRKSGELSAAVALCEEALHLNSDSTSVHSLLGQIQEQQGKREAAIHEYERVLQLNPGSIADRVKLDELRGDGLPTPLHPRSAPHIVVADRADRSLPNPSGRQMLGIAGVAGVLMLLGGLLTAQFFSHSEKNGVRTTGGISRNNAELGTRAPQTDTHSSVAAAAETGVSSGTSAANSAGAALPIHAGGPDLGRPANPNYNPNATSSPQQPPIYIREPPPRVVYVERGAPAAASTRRYNVKLPSMGSSTPRPVSDSGDERVRLSDSGGGQYIIPISAGGGTGDTSTSDSGDKGAVPPKNSGASAGKGAAPTAKNSAGNAGTRVSQDKITVHPNGNVNADSNSNITSDAQGRIVIAGDKFRTGDYDSAIKAYRRALPGAGGQTAYVFQQMGICFQRIKDKASAIENFNSAIQEYQKLESANQQVDLARVGIRLCRNGIKLCKAE